MTAPAGELLELSSFEKRLLLTWLISGAVAFLLPFPATKAALAAVLGVVLLKASAQGLYLAVALCLLFLPFFDTAYKGSILVSGLNLQTVCVAYLWALALAKGSKERVERVNPLGRAVLLFALVATVSAVYSSLTSRLGLWGLLTSLKNWFAYSLFLPLAFRHIREPREKLVIVTAVFVSVILNVLFSLREVSETLSSNLIFLRHRATSFISTQPNLYAGFLAMYLFFFVAFLVHYPLAKRYRLLLIAATGLIVMNLVYTMSRGAWLAALVAAAFIGGIKSRRMVFPAAAILVGVYFWAPEMAAERWDTTFRGAYDPALLLKEDVTTREAASRIIQWRSFLPMLALNPLFGAGFGRYPALFFGGGYYPEPKSAHSSVIEFGVEMGVLGLTLYGLVLWRAYRAGADVFRTATSPLERSLGLGLLGATVCLLLLDLTGTRFRSGEIMAYFWALAGITINSLPVHDSAQRRALRQTNVAPKQNPQASTTTRGPSLPQPGGRS